MENLSLDDERSRIAAQPGVPSGATAQQGQHTVQPLPPQMFTTAAQLLDLTDKKLMVILRDGRKLIGVLRSWDQYANLVLQDTVERIFVHKLYADIKHGLYIIRGENVLLLGEIDLDQDDYVPDAFQETDPKTVYDLQKVDAEKRQKKDKTRAKLLHAYGFEGDLVGDAIL